MSIKKKPGRPKTDPTRDLRADLLRISRLLLNEGGPAALSMREVARRAGCTHQAPYHYFEDRESILAALVVEGFQELTQRMCQANALFSSEGKRAALVEASQAYIHMAITQPGVFRIMFGPDMCNPERFPEAQQAGAQARAQLDELNRILHGSQASATHATILWAHVHGLSCLLVDGSFVQQFETQEQCWQHLREVSEQFVEMLLASDVK